MSEVLKNGTEQGLKDGIEQGFQKAKIDIAKKMLKMNTNINDIIKITGLTKEEIKKIL